MERKRVLWAALGLLLVGAALFAYRWVSPSSPQSSPAPVIFSVDGSGRMSSLLRRFATLLGRGSGRPVAMAELRKVLSSASDDPLARPFADQFMKDPVLRKAWEAHRDGDEAQTFVRDVVETPEFGKLLEQYRQNPDFLALAERTVGSLEDDVVQRSASSDRMLLTGAEPAPGPAAAIRSAPALASPARSSAFASDLARFKSIFSLMEPEPRKRVLAELEQGHQVREACGRAAAAAACDAALKGCQADQACANWLAKNDGNAGANPDKKAVVVLRPDDPPGEDGKTPGGAPPGEQRDLPRGADSGDDDEDSSPANPFRGLPRTKGGQKAPTPASKPKPAPPPPVQYCYPRTCFVAGTRILTPAGEVSIETIRAGDAVLAADLQTGQLVATAVLKTFKSEAKGLRRLTFSSGLELRVTQEHPIFDPETGGFRPVRELSVGDRVGRLSRSDGALGAFPFPWGGTPRRPTTAAGFGFAAPIGRFLETLTLIGTEELSAEGVPVYNFHVGEHENYFAEGVLVHNRKVCAE